MTLAPATRAAVAAYAERTRARFGQRLVRIVLFGSHARGQASEESDVDLLTLVDGLTPADAGEIDAIVGDILTDSDVLLSPLLLSTARFDELRARERRLPAEIEREGIAV
jgi:predicted nucleotidyltransferase